MDRTAAASAMVCPSHPCVGRITNQTPQETKGENLAKGFWDLGDYSSSCLLSHLVTFKSFPKVNWKNLGELHVNKRNTKAVSPYILWTTFSSTAFLNSLALPHNNNNLSVLSC